MGAEEGDLETLGVVAVCDASFVPVAPVGGVRPTSALTPRYPADATESTTSGTTIAAREDRGRGGAVGALGACSVCANASFGLKAGGAVECNNVGATASSESSVGA